jgi:DNA-binding NarL/FixJ family response regulator
MTQPSIPLATVDRLLHLLGHPGTRTVLAAVANPDDTEAAAALANTLPGRLITPVIVLRAEHQLARRNPTRAATVAHNLSPREVEVLRLLGVGLSNAKIGARLNLSTDTIKTHLRRTSTKLGVHTRTEAAAWAWANGLLTAADFTGRKITSDA